ncbi:MAG: IS66 family transposase [Actinomycetota bacterium]
MDANVVYPLIPLPPEPGTLVPVKATLVVDAELGPDGEPDFTARLWRCFCLLTLFFAFTVLVLRRARQHIVELRCQANYWRAQHQRAVVREAALAEQVRQLQGEIRELKRRLFGRKSETTTAAKPKTASNGNAASNGPPRRRGQQPGNKGPARRSHEHLPTDHETCVLPADEQCCGCCGQPFEPIPGTADGEIIEIDVRAYRRRYHRQRYRRTCTCTCAGQPLVVTAPPPDKLIPKSNPGISLWTMILQHKFEFFQPLHRVLAELRSHDLRLAAGTITGGLQKLVPLFEPLYKLLAEHNRDEEHWHCDETRWPVFVKQANKANFNWMLWVFAAKESIVFVLDPTRSHDVPEKHFGENAEGIANVDRYSAYKAMAQVKAGKIILSFCWAHVRRDFLTVLTGWSELTDWAWSWVEDIGLLYDRNDQRLAVKDDAAHAAPFAQADQAVRAQIEHMRQRCDAELAQPDLRLPQRKVLTSLQEHWAGLTVFVDHPEVPMDNNTAERCHRGPVVGRKNFYGSGALWSGRLAAMLFSLFQTLHLWHMNVGKWLTAYLSACAKAKGKPPPDPQLHLPWNMTAAERDRFRAAHQKPPEPQSSPPERPAETTA